MSQLKQVHVMTLSPDCIEALSTSEELLIIRGGNIPVYANGDCGCHNPGCSNTVCGCSSGSNGNCGCA